MAQNFRLKDQRGEDVYLSDLCGEVIVIQMGTMWCPSCQKEAEMIPSLMEEFEGRGLIVLNVLAETPEGTAPTSGELASWAATFDIDTPVLADPNWVIWDRYFPSRTTPGALLLNDEGRIVVKDFVVRGEDISDAF